MPHINVYGPNSLRIELSKPHSDVRSPIAALNVIAVKVEVLHELVIAICYFADREIALTGRV